MIEWYLPHVLSPKQMPIKAVMVSAVLVFFVDAVFFMSIMLLPALVLAAIGFFLFRSWRYEYEYVYVNGDFTISKIIRKEKRKDVFHTDRVDVEAFVKGKRNRWESCRRFYFRQAKPGGLFHEGEGQLDLS